MVVLYSTFHFFLRTWSANRCTRRRTCVAHALLFLSVSLCLSVSQMLSCSTRTVLCSPNADVLIERRLEWSGDEHVDLSKSTGAHMIAWSFASFRSVHTVVVHWSSRVLRAGVAQLLESDEQLAGISHQIDDPDAGAR